MKNYQDKINAAYEMGKAAFGFKGSAPHDNKEFMDTVPNCAFGDNMGVKIRIEMYKAYIKGWTQANMAQDVSDFMDDISKVKVTVGKV